MLKRKKFSLEIAFVLVAVAVGVGFSLKPWKAYSEQKEVRDELISDMKAAEARSEALIRQKARAESSLGSEELARKNGFHRPGEVPADGN
jgi:hypothetical protein